MITPRSFFVVRVFATRVPINNVELLALLDVSTSKQQVCHCWRRMQKILLAVRRDTQEIQARLTYLSACLEQMLQVWQTFGTDATSSKTLLADDTALRRIHSRTSKNAASTTVFQHFDFQMCISPQRRTIHSRTSKNAASTTVFLTFWLSNVHFAIESTVEHQKMLRARQFFNILTFKCAFRHRIHSRTSKNAASTTVF